MLPALAKALISKKVLIPTGIVGGVGGIYFWGRKSDVDEEDKNIQLKNQSQPSQFIGQTKTRKATAKPTTTQQTQQNNETSNTPTVGAFLPELLKLYQLSHILAQQYEEDAKAYYQVFQEYSEKLEKLVPYIALQMSKTPLGMMTGLDLTDKIYHLLKYYPWDYAKEIFPKVLTGYYILKANKHEDLSHYTIEDLVIASENPALAQALDQNILNVLTNLAENYKLVMQSALEQVGKLKDIYAYRLNTLKAQANMIGSLIDAILKEEKQNFEKWLKTFNALSQHQYRMQNINLKQQQIDLKRQQIQQKLQSQNPLIQIERK
jgi:hypothetical protein